MAQSGMAPACPACGSAATQASDGALPPIPRSPADWRARRMLHWLAASPMLGLALAIAAALLLRQRTEVSWTLLGVMLVPGLIGVLAAWNGRVPAGALDEARYQQLLADYEARRAAHGRSRTCRDCGHTFDAPGAS